MKNPTLFAQELIKHQGIKKAFEIASQSVASMEAVGTTGGCPYTEEVEMVEQTVKGADGKLKTQMVTIIDEAKKAKRLTKTLIFWKNVKAYVAKRKPAEQQAA